MKKVYGVALVVLAMILSSLGTAKALNCWAEMNAKRGAGALYALQGAVVNYRERTGHFPNSLQDPLEETASDEATTRSALEGSDCQMAIVVDREDEYCVALFVEAAPERKNATIVGICHGKKEAGEWKRTWHQYYRGDLSR